LAATAISLGLSLSRRAWTIFATSICPAVAVTFPRDFLPRALPP
jgi:hypothetical protein